MATIREQVRSAVETGDYIQQAATKTHERNYERLDCHRDGTLNWQEDVTLDTLTIDRDSDHFAPIPVLAHVGTGSVRCNCDWCDGPNAVESPDEIEHEAETLTGIESEMLAALDAIPVGYFDDEDSVDE